MIKCPECGKEISESAKSCPNCGCDVKKAIKKQKQQKAIDDYNKMSPAEKRQANIALVVFIAVIAILIFAFSQCSKDDQKSKSETCHLCHKTFTYEVYGDYNYRNVHCIRMNNMCIDCYEDYCWAIGKKPKEY